MADKAKVVVKTGATRAIAAFFEYDTPKIVHIKSKKVGVINRLIQLGIISYIIGYAIVYEKGYQEFDEVASASLTKLKGVYKRDEVPGYPPIPDVTGRIWDVADYVVPAEEADATFVTTNIIITANQTQGECDEDPRMSNVSCISDDDCPEGEPVVNGNGVRTGKCVPSTQAPGKVCQIFAWCPVEVDKIPFNGTTYVIEGAANFTLLIKNYIEFPKFGIKRRNIIDDINNASYLQTCRYNSRNKLDQFCPIFELGEIVSSAKQNFTQMAFEGGVIAIDIEWNCNFDYSESNCKPKYSFRRLDDPNVNIAKGWNFRYPYYYRENGVLTRDLNKVYGIRFLVRVTGTAGKFSIVPLLLTIGSGIGLLAVATVLCDIIALNILQRGPFYKENKYLFVTDDDAFQYFNPESTEGHCDQNAGNEIGNKDSNIPHSTNQPGGGESVAELHSIAEGATSVYGQAGTTDVYAYDQNDDVGVKNRKSGNEFDKLED